MIESRCLLAHRYLTRELTRSLALDDAPFDPRSSRDVLGVQRSVPKFTSGDRQDERMSRRSSRYKGGVTRGREERPQGNSTMKRGSPTTERAGSKSNTAAREIVIKRASQNFQEIVKKNEDI